MRLIELIGKADQVSPCDDSKLSFLTSMRACIALKSRICYFTQAWYARGSLKDGRSS